MPRVEIWDNMFDDVIRDRGHDCEWEQAVVCRCVSKDSGQPDYMCPICGGSGYRYLKPITTRVVVTAFNSQNQLEMPELREPGTAYVTPDSNTIMGYKDRLRFPAFRCKFSEVLRFNSQEYGRGISSKTYRNIKNVIFLADDKYEYEQEVDFEITEDGHHLRWLNEEYIDELDGLSMSLLYYTTPSYLVTDILHELRATMSERKTTTEKFVELPKQYRLIREDFIYNIGTPEPVKKPDDSDIDSDRVTEETPKDDFEESWENSGNEISV